MPLSIFLGRPMPGPGEPYFTYDDTALAIAFEEAERQACARCGARKEDLVDDEGMPLDPPRLEASVTTCEGCAEISRLRLDIAEEAHNTGTEGPALQRALAGVSFHLQAFRPAADEDDEGGLTDSL